MKTTRWLITVTDGGDFRKRSREYEVAGNQSTLWQRIAEGMIDELIPNCINKLEIEYTGEAVVRTIYRLNVVMDGELPICQDEACAQAQKCANHKSAYDVGTAHENVYRFYYGMSPDFFFDAREGFGFGCAKVDTNKYEGARLHAAAGILVED